jgi:hypothetical protein
MPPCSATSIVSGRRATGWDCDPQVSHRSHLGARGGVSVRRGVTHVVLTRLRRSRASASQRVRVAIASSHCSRRCSTCWPQHSSTNCVVFRQKRWGHGRGGRHAAGSAHQGSRAAGAPCSNSAFRWRGICATRKYCTWRTWSQRVRRAVIARRQGPPMGPAPALGASLTALRVPADSDAALLPPLRRLISHAGAPRPHRVPISPCAATDHDPRCRCDGGRPVARRHRICGMCGVSHRRCRRRHTRRLGTAEPAPRTVRRH